MNNKFESISILCAISAIIFFIIRTTISINTLESEMKNTYKFNKNADVLFIERGYQIEQIIMKNMTLSDGTTRDINFLSVIKKESK